MNNTLALSARLASARLKDTRGSGALDGFAVLAYGVAAWLAFVVASGTWMFVQRTHTPPAWLVAQGDPTMTELLTEYYVVLAGLACALLVLPILALGGAAARLGARGRARRLASLRLIGMTSGEVVGMSVVESLVQAAAGLVLGVAAWALSVPLLTLLAFQNSPIGAHELLMPWWLWLALAAVVLVLAAASTALGLARVRISPLGVARQTTNPALRAWRVVALVLGVFAIAALGSVMNLQTGVLFVGLIFAALVAFGVGMMNLFAPWLLQALARAGVATGSPARLLAMRRIVADPRSAWRNVSSLALIGVMVGLLSTIPLEGDAFAGMSPINLMLMNDIRSGAYLTLVIAVIVGAAATALTQSSDVVDRADELVALDRMGTPPALDAAARRHQVALPLLVTLAVSLGLGILASVPIVSQMPEQFLIGTGSAIVIGLTVLGSLGLSLLAAESTRPLRSRVLRQQVRRND